MTKKKATNHATVVVEVSARMSHGELTSILAEQIASLPEETIQNMIFACSKAELYNSLWFLEDRKIFAFNSIPLFAWLAPKDQHDKLREIIQGAIYRLEFAQMEADANSPF